MYEYKRSQYDLHSIKLAPNFTASEFMCPHCGDVFIDGRLVSGLQQLRDVLQAPIYIASSYRCPEHERVVANTSQSVHSRGLAADFNLGRIKLILNVFQMCVPIFHRVGIYQTAPDIGFIHVDMDTTRSHLYWLNNRVRTGRDAYEYYDSVELLQKAIRQQRPAVRWATIVI